MDRIQGLIIKKRRLFLILLTMVTVLILSLACSLPFKFIWTGDAENDQALTDQANTAVAQKLTDEAPKLEEGASSGDDEVVQEEEKLPSETPSPSPSPTVTLTPTPEQATAFIKKNTNCRVGPKDVFNLIHIFGNGDWVDVLGKNEAGTFWYIKDQDGGGIECWIWTEYAEIEGSAENLPVFTPPPEPAPIMNFVVSYKSTSGTRVHVYVRNTGNVALQSFYATFKDTVTSEEVVASGNKFGTAAKISVGNTGVISSGHFSASPTDHKINVTVKACSGDDQTEKCFSVSTSFKSE